MARLMPFGKGQAVTAKSAALATALIYVLAAPQVEARRHHSHSSSSAKHHSASSEGENSSSKSKHGRHRGQHHATTASASKTKYAYPVDFFMMQPPDFDRTQLSSDLAERAKTAFESGTADNYSPGYLVRAGVFQYHALHGGIFKRREDVKYIVVHSTESGVPQNAYHVIDGWNSMGRRHPGAQFVVDRDGTIWQSCDPDLATVHVNIFKTLPGINNDNTIGIEMCHAGSQTYPPEQRTAVTRLVSYLQDRYHVLNENIITHRYAQQGDHTDPVAFDWEGFLSQQNGFHNHALAMKREFGPATVDEMAEGADVPTASVYLEMHKTLRIEDVLNRPTPTAAQLLQSEEDNAPAVTKATAERSNAVSGRNCNDTEHGGINDNDSFRQRPAIRGEIELPPDSAVKAGKAAD